MVSSALQFSFLLRKKKIKLRVCELLASSPKQHVFFYLGYKSFRPGHISGTTVIPYNAIRSHIFVFVLAPTAISIILRLIVQPCCYMCCTCHSPVSSVSSHTRLGQSPAWVQLYKPANACKAEIQELLRHPQLSQSQICIRRDP